MNEKYVCCFCGKEIVPNSIDITSLTVLSNWEKSYKLQQTQQLFCHIECLKNKMSKNIQLYIF